MHNENTYDIGEYMREYLNPEEEDFIMNMPEKIESKLEELKLLIKVPYKWPENPDPAYVNNVFQHIIDIENGRYKEDELQTFHSHKINENFKIAIIFEVTCNSDIPWFNKYNFLNNFEISYAMIEEFHLKEDHDINIEIGYGCKNNFSVWIRPSIGKWKSNT